MYGQLSQGKGVDGAGSLGLPPASVWFPGGPFPCPPPKKSQQQVGNGELGRARPRPLEGGAGVRRIGK